MEIKQENTQKDIVEQVIEAINREFEYWFEEYPDIDEADIWWVYRGGEYRHVTSFAKKEGDLAVHYFTNGYCALYAQLLSELFEDGQVFCNDKHMIFFYNGHYYDARGKYTEDVSLFNPVVLTPACINEFCVEYASTISNQELCAMMKIKGEEVLKKIKGMQKEKKQ